MFCGVYSCVHVNYKMKDYLRKKYKHCLGLHMKYSLYQIDMEYNYI
jgi:hypothetical protein